MGHSEMGADRAPPPPGLVAAAEQDYHRVGNDLATLTSRVRVLMDGGFTRFEAVADVWLTLRAHDRSWADLLSAAAVVQLAEAIDKGDTE